MIQMHDIVLTLSSLGRDINHLPVDIYEFYTLLGERYFIGLSLRDIHDTVYTILLIRFVISVLRFNLRTAVGITLISFGSAFLWDRKLLALLKLHWSIWYRYDWAYYLHKDSGRMIRQFKNVLVKNMIADKKRQMPQWYQIHMLFYWGFMRMIQNPDTSGYFSYRFDPISMLMTHFPYDSKAVFYYYRTYHTIIPMIFFTVKRIWMQLKNLVSYTFITRVGKKYTPYFIRWHYTFIMIFELFENPLIQIHERFQYFVFTYRVPILMDEQERRYQSDLKFFWDCEPFNASYGELMSYRENVQVPYNSKIPYIYETVNREYIPTPFDPMNVVAHYGEPNYFFEQMEFDQWVGEMFIYGFALAHLWLIMYCLLHAAFGQYFYIPFIVENTEAHLEPRSKMSKYSGGYTAWQDVDIHTRAGYFPPKVWWGWFSRGTDKGNVLFYLPKRILKKLFRMIRGQIRRLIRKL